MMDFLCGGSVFCFFAAGFGHKKSQRRWMYFAYLCWEYPGINRHYKISIWHDFMACSAFLWLSGVTPAQQVLSTQISFSG